MPFSIVPEVHKKKICQTCTSYKISNVAFHDNMIMGEMPHTTVQQRRQNAES
jgi:hypothetical protein